jgi:two-component system NtrC family sensor kinase
MARSSRTGGKKSEAKAHKPGAVKGRKTSRTRRPAVPATAPDNLRSTSYLSKDLKEAREQQAATAEILKVIASSPSDVQPVFEAIASSANRLIGGFSTAVHRVIDDIVHLMAFTPTNPESDEVLKAAFPRHRSEGPVALVENGETAQIADAETADAKTRQLGRARGWRSVTFTPLMSLGTLIGYIACTRRETGVLPDHHVQLLRTFADQAVIAIENARLFNETQESLERQTATAEILKVIASSPTDVQPVFEAIATSANRLIGGLSTTVFSIIDDEVHLSAFTPTSPAADALLKGSFPRPMDLRRWNDEIRNGRIVQISDVEIEYVDHPDLQEMARLRGFRGLLIVPLLRDQKLIGTINVTRGEPGRFGDHHVRLLQTFANQAVIAIGNVRMFEEVQARTRELTESLQQQTATSDVLQVISSSPGDLVPVFEKMLVNATRVCGAEFGSLLLTESGSIRVAAQYNVPAEFAAAREKRVLAPHPKSPLAMSIRTKQVVHEADLRTTEPYFERHPGMLELVELGGVRTLAIVPMLRDDEVIGAISVYRNEVQLFSDKQIELLSNFAKQAVIAIENARLLSELRQRTSDLSKSLDDLRTAQDRLVQTEKLASLGQLTAGIAHEIKNPLNFVNNFAALSAELTEELNDVLKPTELAEKVRADVDELTGLLKDNLEKVVQHGKRADSIVKNMLLHSREGSREHRTADINSLLDESLNLAYHGARAEKGEFNITLQRDFDGGAGTIELFPQEITRAFLNLIANGVYAATRRKTEDEEPDFEPTLRASTKNLGTTVEIRIRDNGTGIPAEVREKMFNPFFTTKPAGEGTGLGLSMTHDIIVKQHGGRIDVATEPGQFTEFIIVLPRKSNVSGQDRGGT